MQRVQVIDNADGQVRAAAGFIAPIITTAVSRVITWAELSNAGGQLVVKVTATTGSIDITLPADSDSIGASVFVFKTNGGATVSLLGGAGDTIEGSTAAKRYTSSVAERAMVGVISDGTQWMVRAQKGTWAVNNT